MGVPAMCLPLDTRMSIMAKWEQRIGISRSTEIITNNSTNPEESITNTQNNLIATIPDEFLDCITFEMMSLPMVLPSGKVVDKSTLDRHSKSDESWGRAPSDPFTGVPFSANSKPILNAALKSQIDKFLLANQHRSDTRSIARTVGTSSKRSAHFSKNLSSTNESTTYMVQKKIRSEALDSVATLVGGSLDDSVQLALSSLTRFTTPTSSSNNAASSADHDKCRNCKSDQVLYRINQCTHLVCRTCLMDSTRSGAAGTCVCGKVYAKSDVVRYFRKDIC